MAFPANLSSTKTAQFPGPQFPQNEGIATVTAAKKSFLCDRTKPKGTALRAYILSPPQTILKHDHTKWDPPASASPGAELRHMPPCPASMQPLKGRCLFLLPLLMSPKESTSARNSLSVTRSRAKSFHKYLVGPGATVRTPPAPTATSPSPAAPSWAAEVSKVDLQLRCDVIGRLPEVVVYHRVFSVCLEGQQSHQGTEH